MCTIAVGIPKSWGSRVSIYQSWGSRVSIIKDTYLSVWDNRKGLGHTYGEMVDNKNIKLKNSNGFTLREREKQD